LLEKAPRDRNADGLLSYRWKGASFLSPTLHTDLGPCGLTWSSVSRPKSPETASAVEPNPRGSIFDAAGPGRIGYMGDRISHRQDCEPRTMVQKRHFFHVPGFDPHDRATQYRRFVREAARFAATWDVKAQVSAVHEDGAADGHWTVTAQGPGWRTLTSFELLDWSDIVRAELKLSYGRQLGKGMAAFADLIRSGTAWRYFTANWRYGMFFLVPFLSVFLFGAIAIAAAGYVATAVAAALMSTFWGVVAAAPAVALVFSALMRWPGDRWRVTQGLADWIFARDYMRGRHSDMEARVEAFVARIVACARRADVDEIVVAGHSLGATVAVDLLARAFDRDPELGRHGPKLCLLTIGATIPKIALHPKGGWLREKTRRLAAELSLAWAEYQARHDIISFHKFDPVKLARFDSANEPGRPVIRRVQIHQMLSAPTLRRFRFNYMRLHYQFVMANERRTIYDYFMLMCGPAPFARTIAQPNGPDDLYAADGSLRDVVEHDVVESNLG